MSKKDNFRDREIRNLIIMASTTAIIGILMISFYITRDRNDLVTYQENSDTDYKVYLKENEYYKEKFLGKDKSYIASLIDSVVTDFNYKINFSRNIKYQYSYRIAVEVDVDDDNHETNLYHFSEDLVKETPKVTTGNLNIKKTLNIKYEDYNNIISKFKEVYDLKNNDSKLIVNLYVNIDNIENSNSNILKERKVSSVTIPLTQNTVSIDIGNDSITNNKNIIQINKVENYAWALVLSIFAFIITGIYVIYIYIYSKRTRTAQMIYEKEIKSIMNNYDSYIQKISGSYDIGTSQVLKIESFNDMLEIRDTLKQPILMLENKEKNGTFFIIPATNSIIYTYSLRVIDIKAKMEGKEVPTYDITEIPHTEFMKKKKYTDKYIKEQITMTTALPRVDEKNVIKGNKDKSKDLYEQLELTRSFDINEIRKAEKELKRKNKK